jgi:hypothetical protein
MQDSPGEVTLLLAEMKSGNSEALPKLIPLVYHELKRLAAYFLREEREGHTLQATALVNEAYLRPDGRLLAAFLNRDDGIALYSLASRTFRKLTGTGQTRCGSATAAGYCFWTEGRFTCWTARQEARANAARVCGEPRRSAHLLQREHHRSRRVEDRVRTLELTAPCPTREQPMGRFVQTPAGIAAIIGMCVP